MKFHEVRVTVAHTVFHGGDAAHPIFHMSRGMRDRCATAAPYAQWDGAIADRAASHFSYVARHPHHPDQPLRGGATSHYKANNKDWKYRIPE